MGLEALQEAIRRKRILTRPGACWHLYFSNTRENTCLLFKLSSPNGNFCCNILSQQGHPPTVLMAYDSSAYIWVLSIIRAQQTLDALPSAVNLNGIPRMSFSHQKKLLTAAE